MPTHAGLICPNGAISSRRGESPALGVSVCSIVVAARTQGGVLMSFQSAFDVLGPSAAATLLASAAIYGGQARLGGGLTGMADGGRA